MLKRAVCRGVLMIASVLSTISTTAYGQQALKDHSCVVVKETTTKRIKNEALKRVPGFGRGTAKQAVEEATGDLGTGPICRARSQEELLLLTGIMIDHAALSAAKGVDAAQAALGRKRTLEATIAQLEREASGFKPGDPKVTEVVIRQVSEESAQLIEEIADRKKDHALDEKALAKLKEAQHSLNEVEYYSAGASVGGILFARFLDSGASRANLEAMLNSPRIGLGSDFAQSLPARAKKVPSTFANTASLMATINKVVEDPEKADDGAKRAKTLMQEKDADMRKALQGYSLTPRQAAA
jgi:hypothetical protein